MGDYEWSDMPEELAEKLYSFTRLTTVGGECTVQAANDLEEWLLNEMKHCAASPAEWPRMAQSCPDLPVPGSEFCSAHIPQEDLDG